LIDILIKKEEVVSLILLTQFQWRVLRRIFISMDLQL
jgi:hypothetical protein